MIFVGPLSNPSSELNEGRNIGETIQLPFRKMKMLDYSFIPIRIVCILQFHSSNDL